MTASLLWSPAKKGSHVQIDWANLPAKAAFDAYVCWHDFTGSLWTHGAQQQTRLIVELKATLARDGLIHLNSKGLWIASPYRAAALNTKYVTGVCLDGAALKLFCEAAFDDPWIARYEVSEGFLSPDAVGPSGLSQELVATAPASGLGVPVAGFIDYGCAFVNQQFRASDGSIRVAALWDQQANARQGPPPPRNPLAWVANTGYGYGRTANGKALTEYAKQFGPLGALDEGMCYRYAQYEPVLRSATHGTHVMDVATGFADPLRHRHIVPPTPIKDPHVAAIAFVQLPRYRYGTQISGLLKAQVLDAANYIASLRSSDKIAFINLSYGSYCGPHDGSSILELALDELIERAGTSPQRLHIVVPAGNASQLAGHAQMLIGSLQRQTIAWFNMADDPSESFVEIWIPEGSSVRVRAAAEGMTPSASDWVTEGKALRLDRNGETVAMLVYAAKPCQTQPGRGRMILFATGATSGSAPCPHGTWSIEVENLGSSPVLVDAWCERDDPVFGGEGGPRQSRFESHVERTGTLNSIAHGRRTVVVGGYDVHGGSTVELLGPVSSMSSSGPGRGLSGRLRHPPDKYGAAKPGPEVLAPCDLGLGEPGLPGAAVQSGDQVRLLGTSVAAAAYTRWLIDQTLSPPPKVPALPIAPTCPTSPPGRDPHPDDCENLPRVP